MAHTAITEFKKLSLSTTVVNSWEQATKKQQNIANARKTIITEFEVLRATLSFSQAVQKFKENVNFQTVKSNVLMAITSLNGKVPSTNTLKNWIAAFEEGGLAGLLPNHKGSARVNRGWEHIALELYHQPQKPSMKKVAKKLREVHGFSDATDHNVWYFFDNLPSDLGDKSRWRIGSKLYRDGQRAFIIRHTENMKVGDLYQGDGHTLDVYLKHPSTGKLWRAELTVFQDMKSRYIVGWYISNAESSVTTMAALSHGMSTYNHVPLILYIDNGCGFKSKLMNDDTAGFYNSFGMDVTFAIPGNAKAKGNVERFFRVMEEDLNKEFDTYCGKDMSPDVSRHFSSAKMHIMEKNGIHVPTLDEWCEAFESWLIRYHNRPNPEYKNTTPAAMWAQLENTPVHDTNLLVKPREQVNVARATINLHGRKYHMQHLHQFNGEKLVAEYDLHDDSNIRVFDLNGTYLLTADITHKKAAIPTSRIEQRRVIALKESEKRLQNKIRENRLRHSPTHSVHEEQLDALEFITDVESDVVQPLTNQPNDSVIDLNDMLSREILNNDKKDDNDEFDTLCILEEA